ncbi:heat shock protein DnaJ domain protein [Coriobacterium glomerans PW2]|uniref:Heat shock protein DnaJ domain protein n=1 Tax=Coriobacterium glomerans (strain ATCC 49209 / DSM 20642 / JCM 10262 / PW2) TaxID=700015 RepID=F2N9D4_CORGP|nr:J domain-containing protein [Coriobacterium glomerans]AEB07882.1 heat shock protein DnaJ domain protein [Coriobacterium glomerans PW2]
MTRDEAFSVMGLRPEASADEIAIAYRELALMLHPDKFADSKKLQARAERQMRTINEARAVLVGRSASCRPGGDARGHTARRSTGSSEPAAIRFEAEARAHAAETARLTVVSQARTMRERRGSMLAVLGIGIMGMIVLSRFHGAVGRLGMSVSSMLAIWGAVDIFTMSSQINVLDQRARKLLETRDRAREIARQAQEL